MRLGSLGIVVLLAARSVLADGSSWDLTGLFKHPTEPSPAPLSSPKPDLAPPKTKREAIQAAYASDMEKIKERMNRLRGTLRASLEKGKQYAELQAACKGRRAPNQNAYAAARKSIKALSGAPGPVIGKLKRFSDRDFFILNGITWAEGRSQRSAPINKKKEDMSLLFSFTWVMDVFRNRVESKSFGDNFDFGLDPGQFQPAERGYLFACLVTGDYPDDDRISHEQVLMAFRSFASPGHVGAPKGVLFFRSQELYDAEMRRRDPWVTTLEYGKWMTEYEPPPCLNEACDKFKQAMNDKKIAGGKINVFLGRAKVKAKAKGKGA